MTQGPPKKLVFIVVYTESIILCYWQSNFQLQVNPEHSQWFSQAL